MITNHIPPYEERPLVHSETVLVDMSPIGKQIPETSLRQLGNAKVQLENLFTPGAFIALRMGPMLVNDINVFRTNLLAMKPTYEQDLLEHYRYHLVNGSHVTMSEQQFIQMVYDTSFKIYHIYHFFFCNLFTELRNKCGVLGFPNVEMIIHLINVEFTIGKMAIGCYA